MPKEKEENHEPERILKLLARLWADQNNVEIEEIIITRK